MIKTHLVLNFNVSLILSYQGHQKVAMPIIDAIL